MKKQVKPNHYIDDNYLGKGRWMNYYYQIMDCLSTKPKKVLVIGLGDGVVPEYLKKNNISVVTFDFDKALNPDVIGDIREIKRNFKDKKFDTIICAHVLEHLPFEYFNNILGQLSEMGKYLILQLPPSVLQLRMNFAVQPYLGSWNFNINLPLLFWKKYEFNGQHYWQPYRKNHPMNVIRRKIKEHFFIIKKYQNPENHYSYHFILKSKHFGIN